MNVFKSLRIVNLKKYPVSKINSHSMTSVISGMKQRGIK